jgi:RNA polymerase sigma-70 factor, ECF subfamily
MRHDSQPPPVDDPEDRALRELVAAGEIDRATEAAIRRYGPELLGWLLDTLPRADAEEAFSNLSLELWRSLARYDGRCSIRTWCYTLARHAAWRIRARPQHGREVLVSHIPSVLAAVHQARDTTQRRERVAGALFAEIRRTLGEEDQALLVLRIDRSLPWRDIAHILLGETTPADELTRYAAHLRKRFERIKIRLREVAVDRGLGG